MFVQTKDTEQNINLAQQVQHISWLNKHVNGKYVILKKKQPLGSNESHAPEWGLMGNSELDL